MSSTASAPAFSFALPSFNTKTLPFNNSSALPLLSFKRTVSLSLSFNPLHQKTSCPFVRNVALSAEFGQEEDVFSDDGEGPTFSPDLKLFVGNLPFSVDSAQLAGLFTNAGNVEQVEVIYDKTTGRSRGFGFVTMSSTDEVEAAAEQFNGYELEGRALRVNYGPPPPKQSSFSRRESPFSRRESPFSRRESPFSRGPRGGETFDDANRVYVGNLSWGVDDEALETLFNEQGKVLDARVVHDKESGKSRGFGFVTYSSSEEVDNAIESLNGFQLDGRAIRVSVAESMRRRQF